jgi:release factor glutamine methyltransferase
MMTVAEAIRQASDRFALGGLESPRLEARILLEAAASRNTVWIYQNPQSLLAAEVVERFGAFVDRRAAGEPRSYVLGQVEFSGRTFRIDDRVLVPRPETEELVERALAYAAARHARANPVRTVVDVGTGSGAIALSLALELGDVQVVAIDRSAAALQVARMNRARYGIEDRVMLVQADLLDGLDLEADLIVANLPYVPSDQIDHLQIEVRREPREALDGGWDGLRLYDRLFQQIGSRLATPGLFIGEIGSDQGEATLGCAARALPTDVGEVRLDATGRDRFVVVERPDGRNQPMGPELVTGSARV